MENDTHMWLAKGDGQQTIGYRSYGIQTKNKTQFFPNNGRVHTTIWIHHMDADYAHGDKAWRQSHKNAINLNEQILEATSFKTATLRSPNSHL